MDASEALSTSEIVVSTPHEGAPSERVPVHAIMSCPLITISPDARLSQAHATMSSHGVHHLLIRDRGKIVGIVFDRDIAHRLSPATAHGLASRHDEEAMERRVLQVATFNIITIASTATIEDAAALILERNISALPVVNEAREFVGMVTSRDLLRGLLACTLPQAA